MNNLKWQWCDLDEAYVYQSDELGVSATIFKGDHEYELVAVVNKSRSDYLLNTGLCSSMNQATMLIDNLITSKESES